MEGGLPPALIQRVQDLWRVEQVRFLTVGGWNTVVGYACFAVGYWVMGAHLHYLVIGALAHLVAVSQSFAAHRVVVFRSREPWLREYLRFHVGHLGVLGAGFVIMPVLVELCRLAPLVAQALWLVIAVIASYTIHKLYSFRQRGPSPSTKR